MTDEWTPTPDSPAAILDEMEHLKRVAKDLHKWEPPPRTPASDVVTHRELGPLLERIGHAIKQELDRRLAEIEHKQLKLGGVWKAGQRYRENTLCSFQGGLWISLSATEARPGSGSPSWKLCVKKGDAS